MALGKGDILERLAIMTVDGGFSDLEAVRYCLKRWPVSERTLEAWEDAAEGIRDLEAGARSLYERARESALMMMRI